jgi:hypothetical protein
MLSKIKEFQRTAKELDTDPNSIEQFKMYLEAEYPEGGEGSADEVDFAIEKVISSLYEFKNGLDKLRYTNESILEELENMDMVWEVFRTAVTTFVESNTEGES